MERLVQVDCDVQTSKHPLFFLTVIYSGFTERKPLFCRNTLITFTQLHTPGSCSVQPQSDLPTTEQLYWSTWG